MRRYGCLSWDLSEPSTPECSTEGICATDLSQHSEMTVKNDESRQQEWAPALQGVGMKGTAKAAPAPAAAPELCSMVQMHPIGLHRAWQQTHGSASTYTNSSVAKQVRTLCSVAAAQCIHGITRYSHAA